MKPAFAGVALLVAACINDNLERCHDNLCPTGDVCVESGCATPDQAQACDGKAEGDVCQDIPLGYCTGGACRVPLCGDRIVEHGEICDDGNLVANDGCSPTCHSELCGNGI